MPQATAVSPLRFVENLGQWPGSIRFMADGPSMRVRADCEGLGLELPGPGGGVFARLRFEGAAPSEIEGTDRLEGTYSFFIGNDPALWRSDARAYAKVIYRGLYPGVDLVLRSQSGQAEYDLCFAPGVDSGVVRLRIDGLNALGLPAATGLEGISSIGSFLHLPGRSWQVLADGTTVDVHCSWVPCEDGTFGVLVEGRDPGRALVIDPALLWSTYLGGPDDDGAAALAYDADGDLYVASLSTTSSFPTTPGAYQHTTGLSPTIAVTKYRGATGAMVYSSIFGGTENNQEPVGIVVDSQRQAVVAGWTNTLNFPTTPGAFDTVASAPLGAARGFVTKLDSAGTGLVFSTLLEGTSNSAKLTSVTVGPGDSILLGGGAGPDYPVTVGAFQSSFQGGNSDCVISCMDPTGSQLLWSTFVGGTANETVYSLTTDPQGLVYAGISTASTDFPITPGAFLSSNAPYTHLIGAVACLSADGAQLLWSTYLGGHQFSTFDYIFTIDVDVIGSVTVCGGTTGSTFPTTPGAFQTEWSPGGISSGFVTRLAPGGGSLLYSTFLHGYASGVARAVIDASGVATVWGGAYSPFPTTPGAYDTTISGGSDFFVAKLSPQGDRLFYSSVIGGTSTEGGGGLAVIHGDRAAFCGYVYANGTYDLTPGAHQPGWGGGQTDGVVTVLDLFLQGVRSLGRSTPGCLGALHSNVTEMPVAGAQSFSVYCSAAPPLTSGWLLLGAPRTTPLFAQGARVWVDLQQPFRRLPATTDAAGWCEIVLPMPAASTGMRIATQFAFPSPTWCPSASPWVASNALEITVQ